MFDEFLRCGFSSLDSSLVVDQTQAALHLLSVDKLRQVHRVE